MSEKTCYICGVNELGNVRLTKCSEASYKRIKEFADAWSKYGHRIELQEKISTAQWSPNSIYYHRKCYDSLTHKNNLSKLRTRQESLVAVNENQQKYNDKWCIVCQELKKELSSRVSSVRIAEQILQLKSLTSAGLNERLISFNTTDDILRKGVQYHPLCLLNTLKVAQRTESSKNDSRAEKCEQINDDFVSSILRDLTSMGDCSPTLDVQQLVRRYEDLCKNANLSHPPSSLKRFVVSLIQDKEELMNVADFYHYAPNKPPVLASKKVVAKLVYEEHIRENCDHVPDVLDQAAKEIRTDIKSITPWEFTGTFDDFEPPPKLHKLICSIISDNYNLSETKQKEINAVVGNIVQFIYSNFKSDRQLKYHSTVNRGFERHRATPLSVGSALVNYHSNKSKKEIQFLSNIGLSINYDKLERVLSGIAETCVEKSQNEMGIILPSSFKKGKRPIFAADNIDIGGDQSSFHGADLMIAQVDDPLSDSLFPVSIE